MMKVFEKPEVTVIKIDLDEDIVASSCHPVCNAVCSDDCRLKND